MSRIRSGAQNRFVLPASKQFRPAFGLRPRNQHIGRDVEIQRPKFLLAGDVRHRLARKPPLQKPLVSPRLRVVERRIGSNQNLLTAQAQNMTEQHFGVQTGGFDARHSSAAPPWRKTAEICRAGASLAAVV